MPLAREFRLAFRTALAAAFVLAVALPASAGVVGEWLAAEDPLEPCQALIVLNGVLVGVLFGIAGLMRVTSGGA